MTKINGKSIEELHNLQSSLQEEETPEVRAEETDKPNSEAGEKKQSPANEETDTLSGETAISKSAAKTERAVPVVYEPALIEAGRAERRRAEREQHAAREQVRLRALERERKRQGRIVQKKQQARRVKRRIIALGLLVFTLISAIAAFSLKNHPAPLKEPPAEYAVSSLDTVIDTVPVNGEYKTVAISNEGTEVIDFESEINQFLTDDSGFIVFDEPQDYEIPQDSAEPVLPEPDALPEETPQPTPTPIVGRGYAVVSVDGAIVASLKSGEDAQWLKDKLLDAYSKPNAGGKIKKTAFVENVEIFTQEEEPQNVVAREEAFLLLKEKLSVQTTEEVRTEEVVKFGTKYVNDSSMNQGLKKTTQEGSDGKQQSVYTYTYINGEQKEKKLTAKKVIVEPVAQVVAVGTKPVKSAAAAPPPNGTYEPGKVPMGKDYPNIDTSLWRPTPNEGIMGPSSGSLKFAYPCSGKISSYFGWRFGRMHYGVDIPNPTGTSAHASESGTVTSYTGVHSGYGNIVEISHGNGFTTRYAHLDKIMVAVGQKVNKGDVIGTIGTSGTTTSGPHMHFEIRNKGTPYNPRFYVE